MVQAEHRFPVSTRSLRGSGLIREDAMTHKLGNPMERNTRASVETHASCRDHLIHVQRVKRTLPSMSHQVPMINPGTRNSTQLECVT